MSNKTIIQVPVVASNIERFRFSKVQTDWVVTIDYDIKDDVGNLIDHRFVSFTPGAAGQTKIWDIVNNLCVMRINLVERT